MALTAATHGFLGERRLIQPLLNIDQGILEVDLARRVFRFAWHAMSVLMLLSAITVLWPETPSALVLLIGAAWTAVGLFDAVYTRGRHVGWPMLTASGLLAIVGATAGTG